MGGYNNIIPARFLGEVVKMSRDREATQRILEDCDNRTDAMFEAAEWCTKEKKTLEETEAFFQHLKDCWDLNLMA